MKECFVCRQNKVLIQCQNCNFELCQLCQDIYEDFSINKNTEKYTNGDLTFEEYSELINKPKCMVCKTHFIVKNNDIKYYNIFNMFKYIIY